MVAVERALLGEGRDSLATLGWSVIGRWGCHVTSKPGGPSHPERSSPPVRTPGWTTSPRSPCGVGAIKEGDLKVWLHLPEATT